MCYVSQCVCALRFPSLYAAGSPRAPRAVGGQCGWLCANIGHVLFACMHMGDMQFIYKTHAAPFCTPQGKNKSPLCSAPNFWIPLRIHLQSLAHVIRGVGTILLCLSGGFHAVLAIACLDLHTHVPRDPPLVCLQSAGLLGGIQTVLLRFLLALCAT